MRGWERNRARILRAGCDLGCWSGSPIIFTVKQLDGREGPRVSFWNLSRIRTRPGFANACRSGYHLGPWYRGFRKPGEQLRDIRLRLGITVREVAEESQKIAESEGNSEFAISNPWLSQLENSSSVPSIFKLYSLSSIYRFKFIDLLALFGVDLQRLPERQLAARSPNTHLVTIEDPDPEKAVSFPIQFDRGFNLGQYESAVADGRGLGRRSDRFDSAAGYSPWEVWIYRLAGYDHVSAVAAGVVCAD